MSKEDWLYQITLDKIQNLHSLSPMKIIGFNNKIRLPPTLDYTGTCQIQIDIVAVDFAKKILILAECKEFLTLQGASECAEQLSMKTFLLKRYPPSNSIGRNSFNFANLDDYQLLQYISLGSHSGKNYKNAQCSLITELKTRLDFYSTYLDFSNKCYMGILLYKDSCNEPLYKRGTLRYWNNIA